MYLFVHHCILALAEKKKENDYVMCLRFSEYKVPLVMMDQWIPYSVHFPFPFDKKNSRCPHQNHKDVGNKRKICEMLVNFRYQLERIGENREIVSNTTEWIYFVIILWIRKKFRCVIAGVGQSVNR